MKTLLLASLACGLLIAADDPATRRDQDAIKGDWNQTALVLDGRSRVTSGTTVHIDADAITVKHGDESESPAPYTLDPKNQAIDLKLENEGRTLKGIYKVEGKNLKICLNAESRPSEFSSKAGTGNILMEFERP